jgi:hypothetical protein
MLGDWVALSHPCSAAAPARLVALIEVGGFTEPGVWRDFRFNRKTESVLKLDMDVLGADLF